ncbi:MAG TPA: hypothetical protein VK363_03145 [Pyrinomonadaceae bacterium]|nr:hypothetical protein [Pyrinomonadaceae bacterium]
MRKTLMSVSAFAVLAFVAALPAREAAEAESRPPQQEAVKHCEWVAKSLREMQTVKAGATRDELLKVFAEDGGISARTQRTYVYRECRYIKVDVEFKFADGAEQGRDEEAADRIVKISRPYLDWSVTD